MKKSILLAIVSFLLLASCADRDVKYRSGEDDSITHTGDRLPDFSVTSSDGTLYTNQSLKGKVAVIVFFNTTCQDCRKELPVINHVYIMYQNNQQVNFIGISRAQSAVDVSAYWTKQDLQIPYSAQSDRTVYHLFAVQDIPRVYITDMTGTVRFISSDVNMPDETTLSNTIRSYLP